MRRVRGAEEAPKGSRCGQEKLADEFADAHYNLSRLFELLGKHDEALEHLRTYRRLLEDER